MFALRDQFLYLLRNKSFTAVIILLISLNTLPTLGLDLQPYYKILSGEHFKALLFIFNSVAIIWMVSYLISSYKAKHFKDYNKDEKSQIIYHALKGNSPTTVKWLLSIFFIHLFLKEYGQYLKSIMPTIPMDFIKVDSYIEYVFIFLLWLITYQVVKSYHKVKLENLKQDMKKLDPDDDKIAESRNKVTIAANLFRLATLMLLIVLLVVLTQKSGVAFKSVLTFLSIFVVMIGTGGRYFIANIFGGFMVSFYKPFRIGDHIKIKDRDLEGTVKRIGWLTVKIVDTNERITHIPNSVFSLSHVENLSIKRRGKFREELKLVYNDLAAIKKANKGLVKELQTRSFVDEEKGVRAYIVDFNAEYVLVNIECYIKPTRSDRFKSIRQDLLLKIDTFFRENEIELYKRPHHEVKIEE